MEKRKVVIVGKTAGEYKKGSIHELLTDGKAVFKEVGKKPVEISALKGKFKFVEADSTNEELEKLKAENEELKAKVEELEKAAKAKK